MANHALPTTTSTYANFVAEMNARFTDLAIGLDPAFTTATNVTTNSIRWNSALKYWEKYNGSTWAALTTAYSININGSVGATTPSTGAFTTLSTTGIATLGASSTVGGVDIVTISSTQTLTNKTITNPVISTILNTGTLTLPTTTDTLVGRATTDTLTNKTLTAPKFADLGFLADVSGNELIILDSNASAVNEITVANAATTLAPSIAATGGDTNISLNLVSKGTGVVNINGVEAVNLSSAQTLTNKTLTTPKLSSTASGTTAGAIGYLSGILSYGDGTVQRSLVNTDLAQTLTNKTLSTSSIWNGNTIGVGYGGTGTASAPTQGGIIYAGSATAYASTAAGTTYQILQSNGTSAPTWSSFDLSLHAPDSSYKKVVRLATTADLGASTFAANVLTGYDDTFSLALTTTAASTTVTTTGTSGIKVGATINVATQYIAAGTTVASITNATSFVINNRAAITTTAITGNGTTATATFAAQTYTPYAVGSTITVSGTTPSTYSGSFVVTACTTTSVSWASTEVTAATVQGSIAFTVAAGTSVSTSFIQTISALTIDNIAVALNDRILVKDQSTLGNISATDSAKYNGIYYVTSVGSTTVPWTLTRSIDADASTDLDGAIVNISVGTTNGGKAFKTYFLGTSTLNTTPMYWNRLVDASASSLVGTPTTAVGIDVATDTKTQTLVTGNVADLAINSLGITTIKAVATSTYTRASTLYIAGAPVASTNATITTPYSVYVAGGTTYLGGTSTLVGAVTANSTINGLTLASTSLTSAAATNLTITSGTTGILALDSGTTGAINIGTNVNAKTITIGNSTGATAVNINTGTGGTVQTVTGALTNTVSNNIRVSHQTTGTPAVGIGVGIQFEQETAAGNTEIGMQLKTVTTDVTAASEDFDFVVDLMAAGAAAAEKFRVSSTGAIKINNVSTVAAGSAFTYTLPTATANATLLASNGTTVLAGSFNTSATTPVGTTRLNYEGYLYPTYINLIGSADTATAATHYFVETGSDGYVRPKTLANVQTEVVTTAAVAAAGSLAMGTVAKTGAYTVIAGDRGDVLSCNGTFTLTLTAAATLGNGFSFGVVNAGSGTITIDPNASELIDGAATVTVGAGKSCFVICDAGTSWRTIGMSGSGSVADGALYEATTSITSNYTVSAGKNALGVGSVSVASGVSLTVPTGQSLVVVGAGGQSGTPDQYVGISGNQTISGIKNFTTAPQLNGVTFAPGVGVGQTWQNVTGSRVAGTTYYNTTGKPIAVTIRWSSATTNANAFISVNGIAAGYTSDVNPANLIVALFAIVPDGNSYVLTTTSAGTISLWNELR